MVFKFKKVARKAPGGDEKGTTRYYAVAKSADHHARTKGSHPAPAARTAPPVFNRTFCAGKKPGQYPGCTVETTFVLAFARIGRGAKFMDYTSESKKYFANCLFISSLLLHLQTLNLNKPCTHDYKYFLDCTCRVNPGVAVCVVFFPANDERK
ncbi:MAG: hypothetical protein LBS04_04150 [Tannerellaceae bacterium]|jgi:hypothetical protein|nr:hypothetical protein [Tannerellaceae bacterium]